LTTVSPIFGRTITIEEGSIVLRDPSGVVADSLNYGWLVDPWAAKGYQGASGAPTSGCYAPAPGSGFALWSIVVDPAAANTSTGRFPDGADTDTNCADFLTAGFTRLAADADQGATNLKVASVDGFMEGQKIHVGSGATVETATIAAIGTPGATTLRAATEVGATVIPVSSVMGFSREQEITIDSGANSETVKVSAVRNFGIAIFEVMQPLTHPHAAGVQISGSGISLTGALAQTHGRGAQVYTNTPTPGAPNKYDRSKN
jgi:hypothetical protein